MAFFRKIKAGLVKSEFEEYIGEEGQLFFNVETGELRLGDESTPGGISVGGGGGVATLTVSETGNNEIITNEVTRVTAIRFDRDTGFNVENLGAGEVKVSLGSTFKTWKVDGQQDLVAVGEDVIRFVAGSGITITTDPTAEIKTITLSSTGGGSYTLPTATDTVKGGVIIGSNISVDENGTISVTKENLETELLGASITISDVQNGDALLYQSGEWINSPSMYWASRNW
jgi:hypothetical protein